MAVARRDGEVLHVMDGRRRNIEDRRAFLVRNLGVRHLQRVDRRALGARDQVQQLRNLRVERLGGLARRDAGRGIGRQRLGGHGLTRGSCL
ncbi:hypothetical protein D3C86_1720880 [compost metagenome]